MSGDRRCRVQFDRGDQLRPSHNKRHGYLGCDNPSSCFLLSFLFHFLSYLAGPGPFERTFIPPALFKPPRRLLLYQSKKPSPFVPSVGKCSGVNRAAPRLYPTHFRCSAFNPFCPSHHNFGTAWCPSFSLRAKQPVRRRSKRSTLHPIRLSLTLHHPAEHHVPF